ncbi:MAG: hypothetical protein HN348_16500 [Proteobacteria bacterium]|jgi:tellurite resistance protein|nr:hypothetical protein [Pseudomonadota bacterium]
MNVWLPIILLAVFGIVLLAIAVIYQRREVRDIKNTVPPALSREDRREVMRAMAVVALEMCRADGQVREEELEQIRVYIESYDSSFGGRFAEDALDHALATTIDSSNLRRLARLVREHTTRSERMHLLEMTVAVAQADGELAPDERLYLQKVGKWLGFQDILDLDSLSIGD